MRVPVVIFESDRLWRRWCDATGCTCTREESNDLTRAAAAGIKQGRRSPSEEPCRVETFEIIATDEIVDHLIKAK